MSLQICWANGHLMNKCEIFSSSEIHMIHMLGPCLFLFWSISQVGTLFLIASHMNTLVFFGALTCYIFSHHQHLS
uniref:Uncharacterized protein n=1 Tax=Picea sitchensis TaxID=3332 RepID=A0A6B9XVZ1_PICSI|nr:hypothetical protein Q903MT_gene4189 [Picea sitchensis]